MKKAFTLIELVIVVSIIALMAVVAIPFFNTFGYRAELSSKAEEIKSSIEMAYETARSPEIGKNGTEITIDGSSSTAFVSVVRANFRASCTISPCTVTASTTPVEDDVPFSNDIFNITGVKVHMTGGASSASFPSIILIESPGEDANIKMFPRLGNYYSSAEYIEFVLNRKNISDTKTIKINRYPFSVTVE